MMVYNLLKGVNKYYDMMWDEINTFKYNDIVEFGLHLLANVPQYFLSVPASSSGKYHPVGDLGEGGLVRHSISVKRILDHLLEPYGYYNLSDRRMELLKLAALFHDCMKCGTQMEYNTVSKETQFLHPIQAANFIMYQACATEFDYNDAKFVADAISTHMGQWNRNKKGMGKLPMPEEPYQKALHLADYLASRKDINIVLKEEENPEEVIDGENDGEVTETEKKGE